MAGGGFSGVETMAALNDLIRSETKEHDNLGEDDIRSLLIHPGPRLLPEIDEGLLGTPRPPWRAWRARDHEEPR